MGVTLRTGEERAADIAIVAAGVIFGVLLLIVPPFDLGFDEAKYLGIGANIWAGNGPYTAFGTLFLLHSPLWMTVLYAPQALLGIDAVAWGHVLNGVAGTGVVLLAGIIGRRSSPIAGVVAAFAVLGFSYLLILTRTTRLDVPAAAMALLYLEVGWIAASRGSARWAVAAGITFAVAVMVKEVAIPLAPVPILCGVLAGVPWRRILRTGAWLTLAAALGLAPWFAYFAVETGRVYRVETPAWTLSILLLPVVLVIVIGFAAGRLSDWPPLVRASAGVARRLPAWITAHTRGIVGWGITFAWSGAFFYFFSRIPRLKGNPLLDAAQFRLNLGTWALDLAPIGLFIAGGFVLALILLAFDRDARERRGIVDTLVATICGIPLVLMVMSVGEPPRNYIAQVAVAAALAAGAWTWAIGRIVGRLTRGGAHARLARWWMPAIGVIAILLGSAALGGRAWLTREGSSHFSQEAIRTTVDWIRTNVPEGTPIAFGSFLSYEMAYHLVADYPTHQVRHHNAVVKPSMPMGFMFPRAEPADDWVAADTAPRNINEYQAFRAGMVEAALRRFRIGYWVYTTGVETSAPSILPQLTPDHGFDPVAHWTFGSGGRERQVTIFKVDLARAALDRSRLYMSPEALARLVARLEESPEEFRSIAAALLPKIVASPSTDATAADLDRLRALAQP
jgi:hypothetical protein